MPTGQRPDRPENHLTDAELNELVDGTLAGRDLERAQAHLDSCAECEQRLQILQATVLALRQAPSLAPRRSFQLTPAQASLKQKPGWLDRFTERILPGVPAIKAATVAVALLLVSITAFDVLTNQSTQDDSSPSTAFQREADAPIPPASDALPAATDMPVLGQANEPMMADESSAGVTAESESDDSAPAMEASDASNSGSAMQQAPPAPAMAAEQVDAAASPAVEPSGTPETTSTAAPPASAAAVADEDTSQGASAGITLSWWRVAELGLLMLLIWLVVSWVGRTRVGRLDQ